MLSIETRVAEQTVEKGLRTPLLEALEARGFVPLIRSSRARFFEQAAGDAARAREVEHAVAEWTDAEGVEPYVRGDVFCTEELAHFLVFGDEASGGEGVRAGIVYDAETAEPAQRLEAFCRSVSEAYDEAARALGSKAESDAPAPRIEWKRAGGGAREAFERFASNGGTAQATAAGAHASGVQASGAQSPASNARAGTTAERLRALEILEDSGARGFLRRLSEAHADGRASEALAATARTTEHEAMVTRLSGAGLVKREIQVSCRKDGRSLFRLPSADALAIVTASSAVCSECGTAIADERAEELLTPTPLASSMLRDGAWLAGSVRSVLAGLGVPESETASRADSEEGDARLLANVAGEPFLFVLRDGDFNAADARRALEGEADSHATRLVVVSTGKIQDDARARLREHARRRSRAGGSTEVVFVEGLDAAEREIGAALERVAREALTRELYELDAGAGFSVGQALAARFRVARHARGELQDLAASAAGALSGDF